MRILPALLLVCYFGTSPAQRIFYSSQDLSRSDTSQAITTIRPHWLAGQLASHITIVYKNGLKRTINRDSIWGFEDGTHSLYRSYQGNLYKLDQVDDLLRYTSATSRYQLIRYSKTLDSPLYSTKRKAKSDTMMNR